MKNEKFLRGMGEIDDRVLQRYDEIERHMAAPRPNRSHIIRWASLAACLCIMFTLVFFLQQKYGNDENPSVDVGGSEIITEVGTIGGEVTRYNVVRPEDLEEFKNVSKLYNNYIDIELLNIFDASFDSLRFVDAGNYRYEMPALYRYVFDKENPTHTGSGFKVEVSEMTEAEFIRDEYVRIVPLEIAMNYESHGVLFDETFHDNYFIYKSPDGRTATNYIPIGNAYYCFHPGANAPGVKRIVFFVNDHMVEFFFEFKYVDFTTNNDMIMSYPESQVMENLLHLSTASAQIDAILTKWKDALK